MLFLENHYDSGENNAMNNDSTPICEDSLIDSEISNSSDELPAIGGIDIDESCILFTDDRDISFKKSTSCSTDVTSDISASQNHDDTVSQTIISEPEAPTLLEKSRVERETFNFTYNTTLKDIMNVTSDVINEPTN